MAVLPEGVGAHDGVQHRAARQHDGLLGRRRGPGKRNYGHYVENTGDEQLIYIETFKSDHYEEVSLANWLAHLPPQLVAAHLNIPVETLATFPRSTQGIVPLRDRR